MIFLLLLISCVNFFEGVVMARTLPNDRGKRYFLDEEATDDSLSWPGSGDTSLYDQGVPLFTDDSSTTLRNLDQSSVVICDQAQSSQDMFSDVSPSLDARDLIDDFRGVRELVAPLDEVKDSGTCRAPNGQQSGPGNQGGKNPDPDSLFAPPDQDDQIYDLPAGECGGVGGEYIYPLCCDGGQLGDLTYGCRPCEFSTVLLHHSIGICTHDMMFSRFLYLMPRSRTSILLQRIR